MAIRDGVGSNGRRGSAQGFTGAGPQGRDGDDLDHQLADVDSRCSANDRRRSASVSGPNARIGCLTRWWNNCSTNASCVSSLPARNVASSRAPSNVTVSPVAGLVGARRVDRPALLLAPESADGVEVLQARSPSGLIIAVAGHARRRAGLRARPARGSSGSACRSGASGATASGGGRSDRPRTLRGEEHAAVDRRARRRVGERRHQVRVGQHAGPLARRRA